jgi:riboflavin synthase
MFTGIVERTVAISHVTDHGAGRSITLPDVWGDVTRGESIAINGVCLSVADKPEGTLRFDVVAETMACTSLNRLVLGDEVHVERALRAGGRFDGHLVQGHVDGLAVVTRQHADPLDWRLSVRVPAGLAKYLLPKGSICLDGVSLTIARLRGAHVQVALIPTTLSLTRLGRLHAGDAVNVEIDLIAKAIVNHLERRDATPADNESEECWWE